MKSKIYAFLNGVIIFCFFVFGVWFFRYRYKSTNSGIEFRVLEKGDKFDASDDDYYYIDDEVLFNGQVILHRCESPYPKLITVKGIRFNNFDGGFYESLNLLKKNGKVVFRVKAKLLMDENELKYRNEEYGTNCKPDDIVEWRVSLKDVVNQYKIYPVFHEYSEMRKEEAKKRIKLDDEKIEKYVKDKKIHADRKKDGVFLDIVQKGTGENIKVGDKVFIDYFVSFNGKICETSIESVAKENDIWNEGAKYVPLEVTLDEKNMHNSLFCILAYVCEGAELNAFVSPTFAFGENFMFKKEYLGKVFLKIVKVSRKVEKQGDKSKGDNDDKNGKESKENKNVKKK